MNAATLLNCAIGPCALLLLALPAVARPGARRWLPAIVLVALADSVVTLLSATIKLAHIPGTHWNWSGKIADIFVVSAIAVGLILSRQFSARDFGYTIRQAPRTGSALLMVILPFLIFVVFMTVMWFGETKPQSAETLWFEATMPGLAEEPVWRGLLLAMFFRMFEGRFRFLGADLGYGTVATALVFGLVHGVHFGDTLALQTSPIEGIWATLIGFVLAWMRARTKSLVFPILTHNAVNLILETVPLMH